MWVGRGLWEATYNKLYERDVFTKWLCTIKGLLSHWQGVLGDVYNTHAADDEAQATRKGSRYFAWQCCSFSTFLTYIHCTAGV